jgi:TolA-binding protein
MRKHTHPPFWLGVSLAPIVIGLTSWGQTVDAAPSFDERREAIAVSPATQPEDAIISLLTTGLDENKPTQAIAVTQKWLRENVAKNPMLLYHAGRAAELSGDWRSAVALYQQYLKRADLKSESAASAVLAVYTLLLDHLNDVEGAYAYMSNEGHRLHVCGRARQFDLWFLDTAMWRRDHDAVAKRLLACVDDPGISNDLLVARYDQHFRWLLDAIADWRMDSPRFEQGFSATVKSLAKAITFDEELKLRLDWAVSVKQYHMDVLDGNEAVLPVAEATALLHKYPQFAELVQTGWAERRGPHYKDDPKKYWPLDLEAKLAPVKVAAKKLGSLQAADFHLSYEPNYYSGNPQVFTVEEARAFVLANPRVVNSKTGPALALGWDRLTLEEARKLAPHLAQNPGREAALIRAIVAAGEERNFDKAMTALLGPEVWRLSAGDLNGYAADRLWHYCGRPGDNQKRDQEIARSKAVAAAFAKGDVTAEDPAAKRMATFNKLWGDLRSSQPKIPAVRYRLETILQVTPEAVPELLRDQGPLAQMLVRNALDKGFEGLVAHDKGRGLRPYRYDPSILRVAHYNRGMDWLREYGKELYQPHALEAALRAAVADRLNRGKIEPWLAMTWINAQFPENNEESVALMAALVKSPVFETLPFEVRYGARQWFRRTVLTPGQYAYVEASDPALFCDDLIALMEPPEDWALEPVNQPETTGQPAEPPKYMPDVAKATAALKKAIDGIKNAPVRLEIRGLDQLAELDDEVFNDPEVMALMLEIAGPLRTYHSSEHSIRFDERLLRKVIERQDPRVLHETTAYFWRHTELHHRPLETMVSQAESLVEANASAANAWARSGLQTFARYRGGHHYFNDDSDIPRLKAVRGKAALAMGLLEVPVPPNDPAYAIYKSQAEFAAGNEDSARELYDGGADQLPPVLRKLSVPYLLWVLRRTIDQRDEQRQESLVTALLAWSEESTAFSPSQKAAVRIAYGDIAVQRGMLPEAHTIFSGVQNNEEFNGVFARHTAGLRRVKVERLSKDFDAALKTLADLDLERIPQVTTAAHFARAEVYYDMEEYENAADEVAKVLQRDPRHSDATLLRSRIQLRRKQLIEATEVELGTASRQATLVPGEKLKVTLNDPTLTLTGGGSEIEVVVWTTSGDKEHVLLRQFGDQKTKYRGELPTALGVPNSGDRTLQVIGDDEIHYAFSERYRAKVTNLGEHRGGPITVASDAMLMASARKLLSENEQRVADMEAVTAALADKGVASIENTDPEVLARLKAAAAATARRRALQARVKPGNPIHLRVIDDDRSRTDEIDELTVTITSSSGDSVSQVALQETGTHTGRFEGSLPTARAQAMAFASSSETGRNPNMVISPKDGYPAWRPLPNNEEEHTFTVDLNDNAPLGSLQIGASEPGFALKSFLVRTAMNDRTWTTVARGKLGLHPTPAAEGLPEAVAIPKVWHPSIVVMNDTDRYQMGGRPTVYALRELEQHLERGWLRQTFPQGIARNVGGPSQAMPATVPTALQWKRQRAHDCPHVVYRFRGWFYEPADVTRRFRLDLGKHELPVNTHSSLTSLPKFLLAVDGRPITEMPVTEADGERVPNPQAEEIKLAGGELEGEVNLRAGPHRFEIWGIGWVQTTMGFGRATRLQANFGEDDKMVDCPDSFFDPTSFPEGVLEHRNAPAKLTVNDDGTEFSVTFAEDSRARLLRIVFIEHEGPTPSLNFLKLNAPDGSPLLPVPQDFADLRKNDALEILSGDKVTIRYVDDRYVTKGRRKHERFLNVAFTDGRVEFADIEPRYSGRHGKKMAYHERLLRFQHGKPFPIVIHDADMDVTVEADEVTWRALDGEGVERQFVATETGPSTGTFRSFVTPVASLTSNAGEIYIPTDGQLSVTYRDIENDRPGVPTDRFACCDPALFQTPTIEVAHATVTRVEGENTGPAEALHADFVPDVHGLSGSDRERAILERIRARYEITRTFVDAESSPEDGIEVVHGRTALVDVIAPHLALGTAATIDVYLQTDSGRALAGKAEDVPGQPFDLGVPGTLRMTAQLGQTPRTHPSLPRAGYRVVATEGKGLSRARSAEQRIRDHARAGRFRLAIPLIAGELPKYSYADPDRVRELKLPARHGLTVRSGEQIHIGVRYKDDAGKTRWATSSAKVVTHPMLDVMTEGYRHPLSQAFVGEKVYVRVIDLGADRTDGRDTVRCYVASKSGEKHYVYLRETDGHTGIFKGVVQLAYTTADSSSGEVDRGTNYSVARDGLPVAYGDSVGVQYTAATGEKTPPQYFTVAKGSDGAIAPFSKQYNDSAEAMHTQFAMAESYLELARRHRKLGDNEQAAREFSQATQLLQGAITQFRDPETRAHAEYLLGGLTQEDAESTADEELRAQRYRAALARFMTITGSYPDTEYASKAQFKIATIYERLKESDIAAQEYVKLAYKYPESEHLATAMARLGTHFQRKAAIYEAEAKPLLAQVDDKDAQHEGTALKKMAQLEYVKSAQIFARLQSRFPDHELAGKAGLRAGQTYMRAEKYEKAIEALKRVFQDESYDGKTIRSEAMYWAARCHQNLNELLAAYGLFKRITYDFPESKWAAYARGQLSTERLLRLDKQLEIERLEEGR